MTKLGTVHSGQRSSTANRIRNKRKVFAGYPYNLIITEDGENSSNISKFSGLSLPFRLSEASRLGKER